MGTMSERSECDISMLVSYLADQVEETGPGGPGVQAQQQLLLEVVEEKLAETRRAENVARDAIASLVGLRVQLRRALGLRDSLAPARQGQPLARRLQLPVRRAAG
jgi:hypothetical protein